MQTDNEIDRTLGGISGTAEHLRDGLGPDDPRAQRAVRFLETVMPGGAIAIVRLSFEEELAALQRLLPRLRGELADDVEVLGLTPFVDRLEALVERFAKQLDAQPQNLPTFDEVTAARTRAREDLAALVATIVGEFPGRSEAHTTKRVALLAPIMAQNEAIKRQRRRRNTVIDIDPNTGLELDPGAVPETEVETDTPVPAEPLPEPVA